MNRVKITPGAYVGSNELNALQDGARGNLRAVLRLLVSRFGVDPSVSRGTDGPLYVRGVRGREVRISPGVALDRDANLVTVPEAQSLQLPAAPPGTVLYVLVRYEEVTVETGTVNVSANGDMTGFGTEFKSRLRGYPGEPTKVRFPDAVLNRGTYPVATVHSDASASLSALDLVAEANLRYEVLAAFPADDFTAVDDRKAYRNAGFAFEVLSFLPGDVDRRIPLAAVTIGNNFNVFSVADLRPDYTLKLKS